MNLFRKHFGKKLARSGEFGTVTVKQPPAQPVGSVTVKEPPKQPVGSVTVKPPKPQGFGRVIMKSRKFGIDPKAIRQQNAKLVAQPSNAQKQAAIKPVTHVAGVEIPASLHGHFHAGQPVPYDHPAREDAAKFVTSVWRQNENEGRRMSEKLLGIGEGGKVLNPNVKPGYATVKSEMSFSKAYRKVKKIEPGGTSKVPAPPRQDSSASPMQESGRQIQQSLSGGLPEKTGLANVAQELGALFGKGEHKLQDSGINSLLGGTYALITPHRGDASEAQNKESHQRFNSDLKSMGYSPIAATGRWGGSVEPSYLVPNMTREHATQLGRRYGQMAVIHGQNGEHEEIATNGSYTPMGKGRGYVQAGPNEDHTEIMHPGGGSFRFRLNFGPPPEMNGHKHGVAPVGGIPKKVL